MWGPPPDQPLLHAGKIDIWRADLVVSADSLVRFRAVLSPDERKRADRFYFQKDRDKFTAGRGILRYLMAGYTGLKPEEIVFSYSEFGKPVLKHFPDLKFNLSHSADLGVYAFTLQHGIGVDVERYKPDIELETIAKHFFAENERKAILRLPADQQVPAFFRTWTCKEAFIKAHGQGLSLPLDQFEVDVHPDHPAALKAVNWAPEISEQWGIHSFSPKENFIAAVVLEQKIEKIDFFDWQKGQPA